MCGIAGVVGEKSSVDIRAFIRHRGPDGEGLFSAPNIHIGHTRLAILDLSANGHQPMQTEDGRYVISFNGEIYNHRELRAELADRYLFRSTSDTETLLYGFAAWGVAVFARLNGIFACAIYDTVTKRLVLARDPFGVKPLYYYQKDGLFLFSSELKTIARYPDIDKTIDHKALADYLHFLYAPGERTPLLCVRKLLPGHWLAISVQEPVQYHTERYYEIPFDGTVSQQSEANLTDELEECLYRAVTRQLQSDVPLGFFLSGGLDSSAVVAMAKRAHPGELLSCYTIRTATGRYEGFDNDLPYARRVAAHLNVKLIEIEADADSVRDFDQMIYHLDEPQADTAPMNVWNICRQARVHGHTVLLGGAAGDDVFSGYRRHQALRAEPLLNRIPAGLGRFMQQLVANGHSGLPVVRRLMKLTSGLGRSQLERMADYFAWLPLSTNRGLFQVAIREELSTYQPRQQLITALDRIPDEHALLNQMLFWELNYFLPDHNLNYTDKLSMAAGVETRVPFLDNDLVAFAARLPVNLKMHGTTTKYLLRKVMERYLPHDVIYRPKTGFGTPLREWFTSGQLAPLVERYLSEESLLSRNLFDPVAVRRLITDTNTGRVDAHYTIWSLMAIESWFRQFVD